ncbi:BQ5605_C041g11965 [Microbotryum silenes-dioicae]|uniref:BQ5605_C041g11965 protein n=1 Tax=Microbotryum silenes-dioicae TaxID=796604 RepID=A0A2X0PPJ4_9BASI|nr:BQ5605_C041g11965 [Microbotryum silenes-dioicae]
MRLRVRANESRSNRDAQASCIGGDPTLSKVYPSSSTEVYPSLSSEVLPHPVSSVKKSTASTVPHCSRRLTQSTPSQLPPWKGTTSPPHPKQSSSTS